MSQGAVRVPAVIGPIEGSQKPWSTPRFDVTERGYVIEEFHIEGETAAYETVGDDRPTPDGRWVSREYGTAPYRTRILVVRPADPGRFNGTVLVNWQNVSAGVENGSAVSDEIYDGGYAWVGVSAQEVGLYGFPLGMDRRMGSRSAQPLVDHDRERYGALSHPGDQGSFEMFSQAGRVVGPHRDRSVDPMGGLDVKRLVATGGSQSGMRLAAYLNGVHRQHGDVFDGFVLSVWEGRAPRLEEGLMPGGMRTAVRNDLDTPIIIVNSEFEVPNVAALGMNDTDRLRLWEVAGTPHGVARSTYDRPNSQGWVVNRLSYNPVWDGAVRAVHRWLADGIAPPTQPRIAMDDNEGKAPSIRRDSLGNALGGIRLPEMEAPTHEFRGMAFASGRAPLFGAARRFADETIKALYTDRAEYEATWNAAVDHLVDSEAIRPEAAPAMKAAVTAVELPF
ncbi:MAG: alpha/beta hydrolase domain-containing protein [Acidimicrobiia bacterium]